MLNGVYLTTDERNMWTTGLPDFWKVLEIQITFPKTIEIGCLRIWNYNKSTLDSTKGIKEIEVEFEGKV